MKKITGMCLGLVIAVLSSAGCQSTAAGSARNSLDWSGTYRGTLPCASCSGIETKIVLTKNGAFSITEHYVDEEKGDFSNSGQFQWSTDGNSITLLIDNENPRYKVVEGGMIMLNSDGSVPKGVLSQYYHLKKVK